MNDNHSGHTHSHGITNIKLAFFLNLGSAVLEVLIGLWTNSLVILSQALHDFSDTVSLGLSWYFANLAQRGRTEKLSYGYKRYSMLSAVITSIFIIVVSLFVLGEAINRIMHPVHSDAPKMLIFAIIGIATNGVAVLRLRRGKSMNEKVAMWHLMDDVLGWIAVLVVSVLIQIRDIHVLDPIFSIGITLYVLWNVIKNLRQSLLILMQGVPLGIDSDAIQQTLGGISNVVSVHDTHIWSLDGENNVLTAHLVVDKASSQEDVYRVKCHAKQLLTKNNIQHSTLEIEREGENCLSDNC